ncbi:hypothetical protein GCM10007907_08200 [Chitinimonas prasina]|uniref:DUF3570 domain-containing protein n=1 Tax=Chitinimonas prasina TaxID=1434937 RepID=A0ABQ5YAQ0_9NEIS|nr:DUF3570 domain-containing protein [Chitinimonas prasina]GLR12030.1 hypothetical protein GCM10007907_08200 [Chitinimonas prasina]
MQLTPSPQADHANSHPLGLLAAAAMALMPATAQAVAPPDGTSVTVSYLSYQDYDAQRDRMQVHAPQLHLRTALGERFGLEMAATVETMSGASPEFHNALSGASGKGIADRRRAADAKLSHYFDRVVLGLGLAYSDEDDYRSRGAGLDVQWLSEDQNTTLVAGLGSSSDHISATDRPLIQQRRHGKEAMLGLTQVLSPVAIVQSNLTYSRGHGYFSDSYKALDRRPDSRHQLAWLTRYRHYLPALQAAVHLDYRYYRDSWGVRAHSLETSWYQPVGERWLLQPSLRYHSQGAARFYSDRFPPARFNTLYSADSRLGALGAVTVGLKASWHYSAQTTVALQAEHYQQRASWHAGGQGSTAMMPFKANWLSLGLGHRFE